MSNQLTKDMIKLQKDLEREDHWMDTTDINLAHKQFISTKKVTVPSMALLTRNSPEVDAGMLKYLQSPRGQNMWGPQINAGKGKIIGPAQLAAQTRVKFGNGPNITDRPLEHFLRDDFVEDLIVEKLGPSLIFDRFVQRRVITADSATWLRDINSWFEDPNKEDPAQLGPSGQAPSIIADRPVERTAILHRRGFRVDFTFDEMNNNAAFDLISRNLGRSTDWFASYMNDRWAIVMTDNWNVSQTGDNAVHVETADTIWSSASADPIKDIRDLESTFINDDRIQPSDLYLNHDNFREVLEFLEFSQQVWAVDPQDPLKMTLNIGNIRIHDVGFDSGVQASTGLMVSTSQGAPLTMYEKVFPDKTRTGSLHVIRQEDRDLNISFLVFRKWADVLPNPKVVGFIHTL